VNKKRLVFVIIFFVGLAAAVAYMWWVSKQDGAEENELVLYGNVDIREVRLAFNGSEHVGSLLVDEGDPVKAGQLVATLHTDRLQATWERARAEVAAAEAEAHAAQLSYQRIKSLTARKLASKEQADEAQAQSLAADARVNAAKAALAETAQALKDAELYAPVDGIVRERIVEPGDFVTPQTPVLTLALTNPVWVRAYLPESYLGQVKPGAKAQITTDSFPDKVYTGWVGSISPTAEFTPKNVETPELRTRLVYQVRVFACNPQHELRLGMPATVTIPLGQQITTETAPDKQCGSSVQQNHDN
jgi:HlyD family secretion protein